MKSLSLKLYFAAAALTCLFSLAGCVSKENFVINGKPTPFKQYDKGFFNSIQKNWYASNKKNTHLKVGKVMLQFHLQYDGNITDMKVLEDTTGNDQALICQKAVLDLAPYNSWPEDMKRMIGSNYRLITLTFYYW